MTFKFVQPGVDLAVVECLHSFTDRLEHQWLRIKLGIDSKDVEDNSRCCAIISTSYNIAITYNEKKFPFIVVI